MAERAAIDWIKAMINEPTTEARLFCFVFRLQNKRYPEAWEITIGLALVDGSLTVQRLPEAEELRRVHLAAEGARAGLGMFKS